MTIKILALVLLAAMYVVMIGFARWRVYAVLAVAALYLVTGILPLSAVLPAINWNVLMMMAGTMIIVGYFIASRMPNRIADRLLVGLRLEPAAEGLGDGHVAVVGVVRRAADLVHRRAEIIAEVLFHPAADLGLGMPGPGQEDARRNSLCAADSFIRIVTHLRCLPGQV